jgi:hypothetical protein
MPEDQVIAAAAHLTDTLQGIRCPHQHTSTLKLLGDLQDIFHQAVNSTQAPSPIQPLHTPPRVQPKPTPSNNACTVNDKHNITINKEVEIWDQSKEVANWDQSPSKNKLVTFNPCNASDLQVPLHAWRIAPTLQHPSPQPNPSADLNELQTWASSHPTLPLTIPLHATRAVKFKNAQSPKKPSLPA